MRRFAVVGLLGVVLLLATCSAPPLLSTDTRQDRPLTYLGEPIFVWRGFRVWNRSLEGVFDPDEFQSEVRTTLKIWDAAMKKEKIPCNVWKVAVSEVIFQDMVVNTDGSIRGGLAFMARKPPLCIVKLGRNGIAVSALGHELGHVIEYACTGESTNETLEKWSKRYGTPF